MARVDGSLARNLDFGSDLRTAGIRGSSTKGPRLRLASAMRLAGPGKYRVLETRRRRAQIRARHLLDLMDAQETGR